MVDESWCCVLFLVVGGVAAVAILVHNRLADLARRLDTALGNIGRLEERLGKLERDAGLAPEGEPASPKPATLPVFGDAPSLPYAPSARKPSIRDLVEKVHAREGARPAPVATPPPVAPVFPVAGPPAPPAAPPKPSAKRDLELTIGTGWLSRIGMIAILLALGLLLTTLHNRGILVISPAVGIACSVLFGAALLVGGELAHRRGYVIQSYALSGGGIVAVYISLWAGLHYYGIIGPTTAFAGMALATVVGAYQALRHDSEAIACLAWVGGYLVPLLIGEQPRAAPGEGLGPYPLFAYLVMLSLAVFLVAQRKPWLVFTGLSLAGAHVSAAYLHRTSHGDLSCTLGYLAVITAGMLWVAARQRGTDGVAYAAWGAFAGYLVSAVLIASRSTGPAALPYVYLLVLSATLLLLGRIHEWPAVQWCGLVGSFVGFVAMYASHLAILDHWLLLYGAVVVVAAFAALPSQSETAQPQALMAVVAAYFSVALLHGSTHPDRVSPHAVLAFLVGLAAASLGLSVRRDWRPLGRLGAVGGLLAAGLLYDGTPTELSSYYGLVYLVAIAAAAIAIAVRREDEPLGALGVAGAFFGLLLTGAMEWQPTGGFVPLYLAVAALVCTVVIEWRRWYGAEWLVLLGAWGMMAVWRMMGHADGPMPGMLAYSGAYYAILLGGSVRRHVSDQALNRPEGSVFLVVNAAAWFLAVFLETSALAGSQAILGCVALGMAALYATLGAWGTRRHPDDLCFGPVAVGIAVVFLTGAIPLLLDGVAITVAWCAESVALASLGFGLRRYGLRCAALLALCGAAARMVAIDAAVSPDGYRILVNSRAVSGLAVAAALGVCCALYVRYRSLTTREERGLGAAFGAAAAALLWWVVSAEAWCGTGWQFHRGWDAQHSALSVTWTIYGAMMMTVGLIRRNTAFRLAAMAVFAITIGKVFVFDMASLAVEYRILAFMGLGAVLIAVSFGYQRLVRAQAAAEEAEEEDAEPDDRRQ